METTKGMVMDMHGLWMEMNMKACMTMVAGRGMVDTGITVTYLQKSDAV